MLDRREFLRRVAGASLAIAATPVVVLASEPTQDAHATPTLELPEVIVELENYLARHTGRFAWDVHNELRHQYLAVDEDKSRKHADIILKHSVMDDYILNTLSDWHFTRNNPRDGVSVLSNTAHHYSHYVHLHAASLIRIGMEYRRFNMSDDANSTFSHVLSSGFVTRRVVPTLQPYHDLATQYLTV